MPGHLKNEKSFPRLLVEFLDLANGYARQELRATIERAVVQPMRRLGGWLAFTIIASVLYAIAFIFIAVGAFQFLAGLVKAAWIAYLIVGGAFLVVAVVVTILKERTGRGGHAN